MEKILEYNKNVLRVEYKPSLIETFFGDKYRIINYVNIGVNYYNHIKWIDEKTGKLRIEENFDNYVKAQKVIADANN
jgi:hypothetical protein